jgi:Protein of unknown function (DUF1573)
MKQAGIFFGILLSSMSFGQVIEELKFTETDHDFGLIREVDGPAEYQFEFTNIAESPITITNVRASCGCTTPAWTREPVMPGKSGFIKAVYDPRNRPGPFHKTLTVSTSGRQSTIILRIQGKVEPKPRTIEDDFPTVVGALRVKYRAFNMGKIFDNEPSTKRFVVYNQSDKPVAFIPERVEGPAYIKVGFEPQTILPQQRGEIIITYDAKERNDLGFMSDNIVFYTNEEGQAGRKAFSVYADINEYFAPLTPEEAAMAPRLLIDEKVHDFGKIDQGTSVSTSFTLKNAGKSELNIRKTKTSCGCTLASLATETLAPGEEMALKVTFNSAGRRGNQQKSITIYSNDPLKPVQRVTIKAIVQIPANND